MTILLFLSLMALSIRPPINAIIGLGTLALRKNDLDTIFREYFEKIGNSAQDLLSIINDILEMSRLESGREVLQNTEFSLSSMLEQINAQMIPQFSEKGLIYESSVPDKADDLYVGDDKKLNEVLTKILSSILRSAKPKSKVALTVEKTKEYENQATLRFCITDTGRVIWQKQIT